MLIILEKNWRYIFTILRYKELKSFAFKHDLLKLDKKIDFLFKNILNNDLSEIY